MTMRFKQKLLNSSKKQKLNLSVKVKNYLIFEVIYYRNSLPFLLLLLTKIKYWLPFLLFSIGSSTTVTEVK